MSKNAMPVATERQKSALRIATKPAQARTEATATDLSPKAVLAVLWEHLKLIAEQHNAAAGSIYIEMPAQAEGTARAVMMTSSHALTLMADIDAVRLFVLPIEFTSRSSCSKPLVEPNGIMVMIEREGVMQWQTKAGAPLTMAAMNATCHSLFQLLITQSSTRLAS